MKKALIKDIQRLSDAKILIIGDLMVDKYIYGKTNRISPEAPVQVVEVENEEYFLGGAANVARNIKSVGGHVKIIGLVGDDETGEKIKKLFNDANIENDLAIDPNRPTTEKVRILAQNQQLIRVDYEKKSKLSEEMEEFFISTISKESDNFDYVLISDYAKGAITQKVYDHIVETGFKVIVDPKPASKIIYHSAFLITPNKKEASDLIGMDLTDNNIKEIADEIRKITGGNVLLTLSEKGIYMYNETIKKDFQTFAREVYDVSGAGDTLVGVCSAAISAGISMERAAEIANYAAGIVVGRLGTATTTQKEIVEYIDDCNKLKGLLGAK